MILDRAYYNYGNDVKRRKVLLKGRDSQVKTHDIYIYINLAKRDNMLTSKQSEIVFFKVIGL